MSTISRLQLIDLDDWQIVVDLDTKCVVSADHSTDWPSLAPFEVVKKILPYDEGLVAADVLLDGHESYDDLVAMGLIE